MNILLINPPQTYFEHSLGFSKGFPMGLGYIAAMIEKAGHAVEILDTLVSDFAVNKQNKGEVTYGMPDEKIASRIVAKKPDVVGIACPFTAQYSNAARVAQIVKGIDANVLTIVGGPDISVRFKDILLKEKAFDYAVIGEGEYTVVELLAELSKPDGLGKPETVDGIAFRKGEEVVFTTKRGFIRDLDQIPFPAYHLFDMEPYFDATDSFLYAQRWSVKKREMPIFTSRGCPYNCCFCSIHIHMGYMWRSHSAQYVIDHLSFLVKEYGVNHIHFEDDNFTQNLDRVNDVLDGILERGLNFTWDTPNGIRADHLSEEIVLKMKKSGCVRLTIAIESGSQEILNNVIQKKLDLEKVVQAVKIITKQGIPLHAFYVVGFPGEEIEHIETTLNFALDLYERFDVSPGIYVATPLFGTRLHEICVNNGFLTKPLSPKALSESTQGFGLIKTEEFNPDLLANLIQNTLIKKEKIKIRNAIRRKSEKFKRFGVLGRVGIRLYYLSPVQKVKRLMKKIISR